MDVAVLPNLRCSAGSLGGVQLCWCRRSQIRNRLGRGSRNRMQEKVRIVAMPSGQDQVHKQSWLGKPSIAPSVHTMPTLNQPFCALTSPCIKIHQEDKQLIHCCLFLFCQIMNQDYSIHKKYCLAKYHPKHNLWIFESHQYLLTLETEAAGSRKGRFQTTNQEFLCPFAIA